MQETYFITNTRYIILIISYVIYYSNFNNPTGKRTCMTATSFSGYKNIIKYKKNINISSLHQNLRFPRLFKPSYGKN